jgi:hypothetical protein
MAEYPQPNKLPRTPPVGSGSPQPPKRPAWPGYVAWLLAVVWLGQWLVKFVQGQIPDALDVTQPSPRWPSSPR